MTVAYKVEWIRHAVLGGKAKTDELEELLNERARDGWRIKHVIETAVKGRVTKATDGLVVIFERDGAQP